MVILAVSFVGIAAAWTYSVQLLTCWVMLALIITILGASTTLTPVIMLRLIFIILGFQVRRVRRGSIKGPLSEHSSIAEQNVSTTGSCCDNFQ